MLDGVLRRAAWVANRGLRLVGATILVLGLAGAVLADPLSVGERVILGGVCGLLGAALLRWPLASVRFVADLLVPA